MSYPLFDLHCHLEGSIPPDFFLSLQSELNPQEWENFYHFETFRDFILLWCKNQKLMFAHDPEEIIPLAVKKICLEFEKSEIYYVQAHISPIDSTAFRFGLKESCDHGDFYLRVLQAWHDSLSLFSQKNIHVSLIVDIVKAYPKEIAEFQEKILKKNRHRFPFLLGIGLGGGGVKDFTPFKDSVLRLKDHDLELFCHAGETPEPAIAREEIFQALNLGVRGVGHGIYGWKENLELILRKQPFFEVCPTSNLKTRVVQNLQTHPIQKMLESGMDIVIGSDDPGYFGRNLKQEYEFLLQEKILSRDDVKTLQKNAILKSSAPKALKKLALQNFANS